MSDLIERLKAIRDNLSEWDHPITGKEDIDVAIARIRKLEAVVKDDKRCMESLRSLLERCPESCLGEQPDYRGTDGVEQQGWWFRDEAIDRLNKRIRACEAAEATREAAEKARHT